MYSIIQLFALFQLTYIGWFVSAKPDGLSILKYFTIIMFVIYNLVTLFNITSLIPCCLVSSIFVLLMYTLIVLINPSIIHKSSQKFKYNKNIGYFLEVYLHIIPVVYFHFMRSPKHVCASLVFFLFLTQYIAYYKEDILDIYDLSPVISFSTAILITGMVSALSFYIYDKLY